MSRNLLDPEETVVIDGEVIPMAIVKASLHLFQKAHAFHSRRGRSHIGVTLPDPRKPISNEEMERLTLGQVGHLLPSEPKPTSH